LQFASISVNLADRPLPDALPIIAAGGGAPLIEIWGGKPSHFRPDDPEDVQRAVHALADAGMQAFAIHAPFSAPDENLTAPDEANRRRAVQKNCECILAASRLGASVVVIHPGVNMGQNPDVPALVSRSVESIRHLAKTATANGVRVAVESLPPAYLGGQIEQLREIVDGVGSDAVGVCLDTGHAHLGGDVAEWIRALGRRIIAIHLHDNDGTGDQHLPPGEGSIDWASVGDALREIGFSEPITLESGPVEGWTFSRLKKQAAELLNIT